MLFFRVIITDMKVGKSENRKKQPANQILFDDDGPGYANEGATAAELDKFPER